MFLSKKHRTVIRITSIFNVFRIRREIKFIFLDINRIVCLLLPKIKYNWKQYELLDLTNADHVIGRYSLRIINK